MQNKNITIIEYKLNKSSTINSFVFTNDVLAVITKQKDYNF